MRNISTAALLFIYCAACHPTTNDWEVVSNRATWFFESAESLPEGCSSRGPVATTGRSSSRMWFVDNQALSKSNAYTQLSQLAEKAGANTVLIDPSKVVEEIPLDSNREWGLQLAGEAFDCPL